MGRIVKGKHDLMLTNFDAATYCNYCGKKVNYTHAYIRLKDYIVMYICIYKKKVKFEETAITFV